jgi:phosphopantothenoylcysteine synthetase/decarboxylase
LSSGSPLQRILYVIVCGAGPAGNVGHLVDLARSRGFDLQIIATPAALDFVDVDALQAQSGHPIRSQYTTPNASHPRRLPHADAIIVAPATYNTINKWAQGISDTYALGILAEAPGLGIPVVVLPFVNSALASHFAFRRNVEDLRDAGVRILLGPDEFQPHPPGTGGSRLEQFPWQLAVNAADQLTQPL